MLLFIKTESDSSPLIGVLEVVGLTTCAHVCPGERACLSHVDGVPMLLTIMSWYALPLTFRPLMLGRTASVDEPSLSADFPCLRSRSSKDWALLTGPISMSALLCAHEHCMALRILRSMPLKKVRLASVCYIRHRIVALGTIACRRNPTALGLLV